MSELKIAMKEVIDCTPTWKGVVRVLCAVLMDGTSEGKVIAETELGKMADVADAHNEFIKEYRVECKEIIDTMLPLLKVTRLDFGTKHRNIEQWKNAHDLITKLREDLKSL